MILILSLQEVLKKEKVTKICHQIKTIKYQLTQVQFQKINL